MGYALFTTEPKPEPQEENGYSLYVVLLLVHCMGRKLSRGESPCAGMHKYENSPLMNICPLRIHKTL